MTDEELDDLLLLYEHAPGELTPEQAEYVGRLVLSAGPLYDGEDDPEVWTRRYWPNTFTRPFTSYQLEFWQWGFGVEADGRPRPRVECHPRGVGKSTGAETLVARWLARRRVAYVLYVSATDDQAAKHLKSIKRKLESQALLADYPHLAPRVEKYRNAHSNWSGERLVTAGGAVVECVSLLGNARGFKTDEDARIDAIVLDDIDSSKDSPHMVEKKLMILRDEILPAGSDRTVVLFAQNLIHRDSICSQVLDHRADIISRRHFSGPYPLMKRYDAVKEPLPDGSMRWKITDGEPFDPAIDIAYCESLLNQFGKDTFDRECQQDVTKIAADNDFREWDERVHVITRSELAAGFAKVNVKLLDPLGRLRVPARFNVGVGLDWGSTPGHPSAAGYVFRPDETTPFSDCHFVFAEDVLPKFPLDSHEEPEVVSPGRVARAVTATLAAYGVREGQIKEMLMSHEASAARNTLLQDLPEELTLFFEKWRAAVGSGVPQIQNLLEIDARRTHPFRVFPEGHARAGEPLPGRPRVYFVVADGQGELFHHADRLRVVGAADSEGLARARYEMPLYSHRNQGRKKKDDDWVDAFRGLMARFGVMADEKTETEKLIEQLPEELKPAAVLESLGTAAFPELASAAAIAMRQIERRREAEDAESQRAWKRYVGSPVLRGWRRR